MTTGIINSDQSLFRVLGDVREAYKQHRYVKVNYIAGTSRSLPQNAFTHVWYEQIAMILREDDALGWKCYCKLHHGIPILRAEDEEYRTTYDGVLKGLSYEQKLAAMKFWPVTSVMTKGQLSKYAEAVREDFRTKGVELEFARKAA